MNKSIIITGASDGIGKGLALAFARRGFSIGLIARGENRLRNVAEECVTAGSPQTTYRQADVTDSKALRRALSELDNTIEGATIFIANAGIGKITPIENDASATVRTTFETNVLGAIDGIEFMKTLMLKRGKGHIVGISSIVAARGLPRARAYCSSKAALHSYMESLRADLAVKTPLTVSIIAPGYIDTAMTRKIRFPMPFLIDIHKSGEAFAKLILKKKRLIIVPKIWSPVFWILKSLPDFLYYPISRMLT